MTIEVKALANQLLDWCDELEIDVTPMKLQKLVYYCHADFLVAKGRPLIAQEFEAWDFGPVNPSLYQEFKTYGSAPIRDRAMRFNPVTAKRERAILPALGGMLEDLRAIFAVYARMTAGALSNLSHVEQGPWDEARRLFAEGRNPDRRISDALIVAHHSSTFQLSIH